jgi:hypothetical protein
MEDSVDSPHIENKIADLENLVNPYQKFNTGGGGVGDGYSSFILNFKFYYVYIIIPIVLFILLIFFGPDFVKTESINNDGSKTLKFNFKTVLIWSVVLGLIFDIGIYGFRYKMNK